MADPTADQEHPSADSRPDIPGVIIAGTIRTSEPDEGEHHPADTRPDIPGVVVAGTVRTSEPDEGEVNG